MSTGEGTRFTDQRSDLESAKTPSGNLVYTAALYLPEKVKPLCEELRNLCASTNEISVLNPFSSFARLHALRKRFIEREPTYRAELEACLRKLAEPVEGTTALELGWIQGFTFAAGMAATNSLNLAMSSASEALDRKAAYALACFSLYVAGISLTATVVLGVSSLR